MIYTSLRGEFRLPRDKVYLNCAFMAPVSIRVEEAGIAAVRTARDPSFISANDFFDSTRRVRVEFARLINACDWQQISIGPAVSYGMSAAARNIPFAPGDEIIVLHEQFPSHVYPWKRRAKETDAVIVTVLPRGDESWDEAILNAFSPRTRAVCVPNVHWTNGTLIDLVALSKRVRKADAYLIVDGTQSVGALPIDVQEIQPDAMVCAGYKWLTGPYGCAISYWSERFNNGVPMEENWLARKGSENFAGLVAYTDEYQPGALRYDSGGSSNFVIMAMLNEALRQISQWQPGKIQEYCARISDDSIAELRAAGFTIPDRAKRASHLFGIQVPERYDHQELATYLKNNHISVAVRGSSIRVAPNVYNDQSDLEILSDAIIAFTSDPAH